MEIQRCSRFINGEANESLRARTMCYDPCKQRLFLGLTMVTFYHVVSSIPLYEVSRERSSVSPYRGTHCLVVPLQQNQRSRTGLNNLLDCRA